MLAIADKRIPVKAKKTLENFSRVIWFDTHGITYPAISGHPDIFFTKTNEGLIHAPNLPTPVIHELLQEQIPLKSGERIVGGKYPENIAYNALITKRYLIHNLNYTDPIVLKYSMNKEQLHVNQGYTRCNLIFLNDQYFLTSDRGIFNLLQKHKLSGLFIDPTGILLPGLKHGFIGGCMGIMDDQLFVIGNIDFLQEKEALKNLVNDAGLNIISLYDGPLFDGGSILFIQ